MPLIEYIWIDGFGGLRSKARTLSHVDDIPKWNYDGSSTGQANIDNSEVILTPIAEYKDPFNRNSKDNKLILCDSPERRKAHEIFEKYKTTKPWYGMEQEFFIMDPHLCSHLKGSHYCGVGIYGRDMMNEFYEHCLYCGISISGINAEVSPAQWEYQVGPVEGLKSCDDLWMSRYILMRTSESTKYPYNINFQPKPYGGDWNCSGCHVNFSTESMRTPPNGLDAIHTAVESLSKKHKEHIDMYGLGNELRLTGTHETSSYEKFTAGCGDRTASIRIGTETVSNGYGYFEDRRPSSNMNPYLVNSKILETISK